MPTQQKGPTRRAFLRSTLVGLASAGSRGLWLPFLMPTAAQVQDPLQRTRQVLRRIILQHAAAEDTPQLVIHGIRAMGEGFMVNGQPAIRHLCARYLQEKVVKGQTYLYMPIEHEGHTNAFLSEALLDRGVPQSYPFRWNRRRYTVADLVAGAKATFAFAPSSQDPNDLAWSLLAFAQATAPRRDGWVNAWGMRVRFSEVVELGLAILEQESMRLQGAMLHGSPPADETPDPGGIRSYACAGTHLIYGLTACLRRGHQQPDFADRMRSQLDLLVWRLEADSRLVDRYYLQVSSDQPAEIIQFYRWDAKLKFLGHAFEVLNYARRFRLFEPTGDQRQTVARAQQELIEIIEAIGSVDLRRHVGDKELFDLLVSDACHAYHGLQLAAV